MRSSGSDGHVLVSASKIAPGWLEIGASTGLGARQIIENIGRRNIMRLAPMAYVPGFEYDLFISYASDDYDGRLAQFVQELQIYLRRTLGKDFSEHSIFFDRQELNLTPVQWKRKLQDSAKSAAVLIPILSPSYATSDYCAKEWEWFCDEHPLNWPAGPETVFRVCPVRWREIDPDLMQQVAPEIRSAQEQRSLSAEDLGAKIANGLRLIWRSRHTVYVGEAEHEVRTNLRHELSRTGFRVMPQGPAARFQVEDIRPFLEELGWKG
jgi:TIR domain